ncbi:glutathione peroxidase [Rhodobacteraceae bacterium N5(2021)]|uniref:Glutathione peroxidase n=1 Tax=Gymnodinialimonas phycosphaerae TaxID=2841589 RepID=A0A975YHQ1_9RHOB|nr:glutathione peroxidase [Gymnodinialimonas phycosphaerae]MBY4893073.1 glutathione peroxidase [Gymnodinialimonas phycosphaerae]
MDRRLFLTLSAATALTLSTARQGQATQAFRFPSIDGGDYELSDWRGQPVLVVNTASLCGYTDQYSGLQRLHEAYAGRAVVLAVPSDDFAQELGSDAEVAAFCEVNFGLTLPMTTIQSVRGPGAHPFYRWMAQDHGFVPRWNFNKVLLDGSGQPVATWGSNPDPMGSRIRGAIDGLLTA